MGTDILYLVIPFFITLIIGVPISISLGIGVLSILLFTNQMPLSVLTQQMYNSAASFPLMAIPFFIFAGDLMNESGITSRLIDFAKILLMRIRGGLAQSLVLTSAVFAGLTGSAAADTAATIKIMAPSMKKEGYESDFIAALSAASGVLGPIIPPSTIMIVYGATIGTSVGAMFMGGVIPGIVITLFLMGTVSIIAKKRGYPKSEQQFSLRILAQGFKDASLALIAPVIILVGIRGGVFTPTEGGAVAVAYSLLIGFLVYRTLTLRIVFQSAVGSGITAAIIMLVVSASSPFGWLVSIAQVPQMFAEAVQNFTDNVYLILLLINLMLLLAGMFLEGAAIVLLVAPILAPVAEVMGVHPVHFAVMMCVNICIGMITPPVGVNLFIAAPIAGVSMVQISRAVMPFLIAELLALTCITLIPDLVLWLPSVFR